MTILANNAPVSIPAGVQELGPFTVPDGLSTLYVKLLYCTSATPTMWASALTVVTLEFLLSTDGGATYRTLAAMTTNGGLHIQDGAEQPYTDLWVGPMPAGLGRKTKVRVTVTGPTLSTQATVEAR